MIEFEEFLIFLIYGLVLFLPMKISNSPKGTNGPKDSQK